MEFQPVQAPIKTRGPLARASVSSDLVSKTLRLTLSKALQLKMFDLSLIGEFLDVQKSEADDVLFLKLQIAHPKTAHQIEATASRANARIDLDITDCELFAADDHPQVAVHKVIEGGVILSLHMPIVAAPEGGDDA
ncbi:MAG: hypothetical protein AAFU34_15645 [Pseudomonadota bacterium]